MKYSNYCRVCQSENLIKQGAVLSPFITYRIHGILPSLTTNLYNLENGTNYLPCETHGCKECGFIGSNLIFDHDEMSRLYRSYMTGDYMEQRVRFEGQFVPGGSRPPISAVEEFISGVPSSVIDYGATDTDRTPFGNCGYVTLTDIQNELKTDEHFDLLTCLHVLEHVCDPHETLRDICTYNFDRAYFEVPHERYLQGEPIGRSLEDQVRGKQFWHEHLNFYSYESFKTLLNNYFDIINSQVTSEVIQIICRKKDQVDFGY